MYTINKFAGLPQGGRRQQAYLNGIATAVLADLVQRNLPRLNPVLLHKYAYTDLPCPSIATRRPEIHAVFIDHNDSTENVFIVFRKAYDQNLSYEGFYPFGVDENNIVLISFYVGLFLTLEYDRQYQQEWSMQRIIQKYPELATSPCGLGADIQRFGFEVLGYAPEVFQPPYNIVLAT